MKLEVEMTPEQLKLLILSTEVYARSLMNQPRLVADILADTVLSYNKEDPENDRKFKEWLEQRDIFTYKLEDALNTMFKDGYKSDTCQNLIDIWHVLSHLQYNLSGSSNSSDTRSSKPFQGGTEPLIQVRVLEKE